MGTFHRGIHGTLLRPKNQKCCPQGQSAGGSEWDLLGTITPWANLASPVYFCIFLCAATVIFTLTCPHSPPCCPDPAQMPLPPSPPSLDTPLCTALPVA